MEAGVILLAVGFLLLGGSALGAFFWAVRDGQLQNLADGANAIFDEGEPVGQATDCFPDERSHRAIKKLQKS
jgi:cbb3-type cytochrome oxidase maturation protein